MLKTYDSTLQAYTEHPPKNYDATLNAWIDSPSLKTFDTAQNAWVERLYQDYFTLRQDSSTPKLSDGDELVVTNSGVTLTTAKKSERRTVTFDLPFKWAGETVELELVSNGIAYVYFGRKYSYGTAGSTSGYYKVIPNAYDGAVTYQLDTCPDEVDGQTVTSSILFIEITASADTANTDNGYVNIKNLKINGKKYGFKEV